MPLIARTEDGFSIVELLITLMVAGIVFAAFSTTFISIQSVTKKGSDIVAANALAFAKVQQYENKDFTSLPTTSPTGTLQQVEDFSTSLPTNFEKPRTALVHLNTVSPTLKQIVVTITFGSGDSQRLIQYGDFIQRNGVGR